MMATSEVIEILKELLVDEQHGLPVRLRESTVFVSQMGTRQIAAVNRMAQAGREHCAELAFLILEMGGTPGPRGANAATADLHYQDIRHALPRLAADRESLVELYELARDRLAAEPIVTQALNKMLARHRQELEEIRGLIAGNLTPAA